jgi:cell volume regulation protein A
MPDLLERWRRGPVGEEVRPPRELIGASRVFTSRPWDEERDGDPAYPDELLGVGVLEHLRTRRDRRGALLALADGRYAVTGPTLAAGGARQLQAYARRRLARETDETARAWWQEVIGALAR